MEGKTTQSENDTNSVKRSNVIDTLYTLTNQSKKDDGSDVMENMTNSMVSLLVVALSDIPYNLDLEDALDSIQSQTEQIHMDKGSSKSDSKKILRRIVAALEENLGAAPESKGPLVDGLPALLRSETKSSRKAHKTLTHNITNVGKLSRAQDLPEDTWRKFDELREKYPESQKAMDGMAKIFIGLIGTDVEYYYRVQEFVKEIDKRREIEEEKRKVAAERFKNYMSDLRRWINDYKEATGNYEKVNARLELENAELKDEKSVLKQQHLKDIEAKNMIIAKHEQTINDVGKEKLRIIESHAEEIARISKNFDAMKDICKKRKQSLATAEKDNKHLEEKILTLQSQLDQDPQVQTDDKLKKELEELKAECNVLRSHSKTSKDMEKKISDIAAAKAVIEPNKKIAELENKLEILEQGRLADHEVMVKYSQDIDELKSEKSSFEESQKSLNDENVELKAKLEILEQGRLADHDMMVKYSRDIDELKGEKSSSEEHRKRLQDEVVELNAKLDMYRTLINIRR
ncbi:hypothetical protein GLAREA_11701 [Glarea lozoyensis ATCC 20868]|uniref:Uncharacterized protein n=2 Tax=Glarea lozoyensis TaxID=101852 RepID=S3CGV5_GLAL2|nr:uncharacterized protein GLAREA_11701 [Glarea lozoyensis ATCC 20868]EPE25120.1 hypothetical protein GLAREA_11701 [Glarea lozoyensis ATCC 20868]